MITYKVNESIIDGQDSDYVSNEETFSTPDLLVAVTYAVGRMGMHTYVRGYEWEHIFNLGDDKAVLSVWALVPGSSREHYIGIEAVTTN